MEEEKKELEKQEDLAAMIIANAGNEGNDDNQELVADEKVDKEIENAEDENHKVFQKYKIKDFVFLAIMAGCMLITCSIMPLVINVPVFGIIQMALGIQCSLFPVIGLMKVRKSGALLIMCACYGIFIVFIQPIMGIGILICALVTEALVLLFFRGFKKSVACLFAGTIFFPLSLPILYLYYNFMFSGEAGVAVNALINPSAGMAIGITFAVLAICFVGSLIGMIISKELKKAGALKK